MLCTAESSRGRPERLESTRELVIAGTPYLVVYRVSGMSLRLLHGAQERSLSDSE